MGCTTAGNCYVETLILALVMIYVEVKRKRILGDRENNRKKGFEIFF